MKREVVALARAASAEGWTQKQVGDALGLNKATICGWVRDGKPKSRTKAPLIKAVRVEPTPAKAAVTLELAGGHRVEGLAVAQLAELIKALV